MKKLLMSCLLSAGAGLVACGGSAELQNAVPDSSTLVLDMESGDGSTSQQALDQAACHPHLFMRTREVVGLLNLHILKVFGRIDQLVASHPKQATSTAATWEATSSTNDVAVKVTFTKATTGYTFEVDMKKPSDPDTAYVTIGTGTLAPTDGQPHTGAGTMHMDLTALTNLVPAEKATGTIDVTFNVTGNTKTIQVQVTNFQPDSTDTDRPPRNGNYVFQRTKGVGGSLKFEENVVLFCPANPNQLPATVQTVARWGTVNGKLQGRADSLGTGGQIPSGDQWMGMTCFDMSSPDSSAERYWQMKLEDGSGNVVKSDATYSAADTSDATTTCDPSFGAVPDMSDNQGDFNFGAINFNDGSVVPYPGQPAGSTQS
jgi:hypothetical protein